MSYEEDKIGFAISSGAYFVETNGGGNGKPGGDPMITAYKANAAVAKYSRDVAKEIFGEHRVYGYSFGGSGGAYRTIGGIENSDAWDGAVPYVVGSPVAIPNVFAVRMHAMRILDHKFPQIIDALQPGGSGDMYVGLNEEEKAALTEVTKMGFPPQSWFGYKTMGVHGFAAVYGGMVSADPGYYGDFWEKPGYLGYDHPESFKNARLKQTGKIKRAIYEKEAVELGLIAAPSAKERGTAEAAWKGQGQNEAGKIPVAFQLEEELPNIPFLGGDLNIKSGVAYGKTISLNAVGRDKIIVGVGNLETVAQLNAGDLVEVDNSRFLAAQTYHRHQVPGKEYKVWDQFRDGQGKPIYPQRARLLGPSFTMAASGVLPSGDIKGKVIILSALWDREAFPWQGDWYKAKIEEKLGSNKASDNYRLWYMDRALHGDLSAQEDPTRTVSYLGILQQALRDLSLWVEKGIAPSPTTSYQIVDGQVIVPPTAKDRNGIQPTADLTVNGKKSVEVSKGKKIKLKASVDLPAKTGSIVSVEWDFDGKGTFGTKGKFKKRLGGAKASISHRFTEPGIYFVTVRAISERNGNTTTPFARIQNLDKVRVVVK
ncbi:PKD domain-containing protein [Elizabethkingia anophelis]|uniref:PKD domain-containing protein n=1 Tax=Elizabethkingia anophelis TaxID=1117645 RepID=UPI003891B0FB